MSPVVKGGGPYLSEELKRIWPTLLRAIRTRGVVCRGLHEVQHLWLDSGAGYGGDRAVFGAVPAEVIDTATF